MAAINVKLFSNNTGAYTLDYFSSKNSKISPHVNHNFFGFLLKYMDFNIKTIFTSMCFPL